MNNNAFPNSNVRYRDTHDVGGISVEGINLTTDETGFIEAPPRLEGNLAPHGFLREGSKAYADWQRDQPKDANVAVTGVGAGAKVGMLRK